MAMCMQWVRQEHENGCGLAALAMLTGQTYQQVAADFSQPLEDGRIIDFSRAGLGMQHIDRYLAERGFAVCRLYLRDLFGPQVQWPPKPFADVHLCEVRASREPNWRHCVVMLIDGSVLDPERPVPMRLINYREVYSVAAVVKLPAPSLLCKEPLSTVEL